VALSLNTELEGVLADLPYGRFPDAAAFVPAAVRAKRGAAMAADRSIVIRVTPISAPLSPLADTPK
jgi:hypothetical protein